MIEVGLGARVVESKKWQSCVARFSRILAGLDHEVLDTLSRVDTKVGVNACHREMASARAVADTLVTRSKGEYSSFKKLHKQSVGLSQELRELAGRIIQINEIPDKCPLCHTQFEPGKLASHMNLGVNQHLEAAAQKLLVQIRDQETAAAEARNREMASAWLEQFCARAGLPADVSVEQGLTDLKKVEKAMASAKARLQALEGELLALEKQGFSAAQLEEIDLHLHRLGYQIDIGSDEALDLVISKLNSELTGFTRMLETELQLADALRRSLQADLGEDEPDIQNFRNALSELNERLVWTNNIRTRLSQFLLSFPWPAGGPIAELAVEAESIRKVAADLQTALNRERQARTSQAETIKRKDELEKSLVALRARIQRFADAYFVLKDLHDNYSLSAAMEAALRQNRVSIEKIFAQIHSPAEFQGLGSKVDTLVRKGNGDEAALSQISTGQRAAFALSIFLAQNAQLSAAPPIILIDDPIAHVDDLNSLSFLDYLREIALTGRRQIFFATAKDKLATLFERKFDFWALTNFAGTTYVEMRA